MRTFLYILFFLQTVFAGGLNSNTNWKDKGITRLEIPSFIPVNTPFEISLISISPTSEFNEIEISFLTEERLQIQKAELFTSTGIYKFNIQNTSGTSKLNIRIDSTILQSNSFFQILVSFRGSQQNSARFRINGNYKINNKFVKNFTYKEDEFTTNTEEKDLSKDSTSSLKGSLSFYRPQRTAGKSITFEEKGMMVITLPENINSNILLDFWLKAQENDITFLKLINSLNESKRYEVSISKNQLLGVESANNDFDFKDNLFISKRNWYQITVYFSFINKTISFYKNGKLFYRGRLTELLSSGNIKIEFSNNLKEKSFQIDALRIFEYNEELDLIFRHKHFNPANSDKVKMLYQYSFDTLEEGQLELEKRFRKIEHGLIIKSDAPIFLRSPEINIRYLGNSTEIEWYAVDYQNAQSFVLEKSIDGTNFSALVTITAENSPDKKYSFVERNNTKNGDIIYYRVKQINNDGSSTFSSMIKVGTGNFDFFTIEQNYPNPFNPRTSFKVEVIEEQEFDITIYNLEGSEIEKVHQGVLTKGFHIFTFDGTNLPSGIYLLNVHSTGNSKTIKMILTK